jgi:hypothetical protein
MVMSSIGLLTRHFRDPDHLNHNPVYRGSVLVAGDFNGFALRIDVLRKFSVHPASKLEAGLRVGRYVYHGLDGIVSERFEQFADFP